LLTPAKVEPASIRQVELTAVILLLVASNRGVAVLPDWVVREVKYSSDYITRPLTATPITRRLYAAVRQVDLEKPFVADLIRFAGEEARRLQSA
jgi:LysR family transcriptional regulator for metE and metH